MRILHIGKYWPMSGGMETVIFDIVSHFSNKGVRCDLLAVATDGGVDMDLNENCHIMCVPELIKVSSASLAPAMISRLRKIVASYDVVHIHCPNPMGNVALLLSGFKGEVIVHWHSDIIKQKFLLTFYRPLQNWLIKRAKFILGTSQRYLDNSTDLIGMQNKVLTMPLGVEQIKPSMDGVVGVRDAYAGKKIILTVGRLVPYKGHKYLIEAATHLGPEYVVLIAGNGPLKQQLEKLIEGLNLQERVHLLGNVTNEFLHDLYGACDVFCLSSIWKTEAFGLVQIEAMSCGKPVVATDIEGSGVPWVNKNGYSGINVEPENPKALADAIKSILSDSETYKMYSENARQRYKELFTKEKMLERCEEIYNML